MGENKPFRMKSFGLIRSSLINQLKKKQNTHKRTGEALIKANI